MWEQESSFFGNRIQRGFWPPPLPVNGLPKRIEDKMYSKNYDVVIIDVQGSDSKSLLALKTRRIELSYY